MPDGLRWVRVIAESALGATSGGKAACVRVGTRKIALFEVGGEVFAIDDTCTHLDAPLSEGKIWRGRVICPWHGAQFDLRTGVASGPPARGEVGTYRSRVEDGQVWVEVPRTEEP